MPIYSYRAASGPNRTVLAVVLVLLHLFVAPCATAMVLMPADMDCEHCQTMNSPDDCAVASAATRSVIEGVAFDSGRADPPLHFAPLSALLPAELTPASAGTLPLAQRSRALGTRHSADSPLYLVLGQLRL